MYGLIYWIGHESKTVLHENYYKILNGKVTATDDNKIYYSARLMAESENASYLDKLVVTKDGLKLYSEHQEYLIRSFSIDQFLYGEASERMLTRLANKISSDSDVNSKTHNSRKRSARKNIPVASNGTPSQKRCEAYNSNSEDISDETWEIVPYRDADVSSESSQSSVGSSDMPDDISTSKYFISNSDDTPVETSEKMPCRDADVSFASNSQSSQQSYTESIELGSIPKPADRQVSPIQRGMTNLTCAAEALRFKTELIAGTGVYVDTKKLEQYLSKYKFKSNRLATALMREIVGEDKLIKMSCTGRAPYERIPVNVYNAIEQYVEFKAEPSMSSDAFQTVIKFLCQKIRDAKKSKVIETFKKTF